MAAEFEETVIWIELSTSVEPEAVDAVCELFGRLGHGGVAIDQPLSDGPDLERAQPDGSRPVTVKTYLPEDGDVEARIARVEEGLWHLSQLRHIEPLQVARLAEQDWAEAWKEFFFVHRIGERLIVKPSWREYLPGAGEVVVELDPGMAFGTGLHPTTRTCMLACERYVREGMRVLDVGTGSGILAIAAAGLGAASVLAVDVDGVAVEAARKNVAMNRLEHRVLVQPGSLDGVEVGSRFDLITANLIAGVLVDLAAGFGPLLTPGGHLVVSGIIDQREEWVRAALEAVGLQVLETLSEGDWRTMVCGHGGA